MDFLNSVVVMELNIYYISAEGLVLARQVF
jgi:hypothetical protein